MYTNYKSISYKYISYIYKISINRGFYTCNIQYNNINNPNFKAIFTIA